MLLTLTPKLIKITCHEMRMLYPPYSARQYHKAVARPLLSLLSPANHVVRSITYIGSIPTKLCTSMHILHDVFSVDQLSHVDHIAERQTVTVAHPWVPGIECQLHSVIASTWQLHQADTPHLQAEQQSHIN